MDLPSRSRLAGLEARDLLLLLKQDGHHQGIEGDRTGGAGGLGDVAFGVTEKLVEGLAVLLGQGAAEVRPGAELILEVIGEGGDGSAHVGGPPERIGD